MKIIIGAAILYCLLAVCSAQDAEAQWHLRAPVRGCVQVIYRIGGSTFLAYACDGVQNSCIFAPHVNRCPVSVAFQRPNFERIINIRATDHVVRFYMSFGVGCILTILPDCCPTVAAQGDEECKHVKWGDEIMDDPLGCYTGTEPDTRVQQISDTHVQQVSEDTQHMLNEFLQKLLANKE